MMLEELKRELRVYENPEKAAFFPRFFKTGPGEYGEGDVFLGITVPSCRLVAKKFIDLPLKSIEKLLASQWHEERLVALLIMVYRFKKVDESGKKELHESYLAHKDRVNNWDLVDTSARDIVGGYLYTHQELLPVLDTLANSNVLWDRRIAITATFYFLTQGDPVPTLHLSEKLLQDKEDLMQKAVGWMLREMGKRCDRQLLIDFLAAHYRTMPRTTLRYAIEHFDEPTRKQYLSGLL